MNIKITIAAIIILHAISSKGAAQNNNLKFNLVEGPSGKPLGKINAITQDPHGYMWFVGSGEKCIYRYDGNKFTIFRHDDANPNSLGLTTLETVHADNAGMIWIGGEGLDRYDPATGIFKHYKHVQNDPGSMNGNYVYSILKDHQGRIWVGTQNGLDLLDEKTGKFIHYRNEPGNLKSLSSNVVWRIYEDRQGVIWIATGTPWNKIDPDDGGLNRLEPNGTFTRYMHDSNDPHSLINNKVAAAYEDSHGTFWVGTGGDGLHTMDRQTGKFERHLYNPNKPEQLSRPPIYHGQDSFTITNDKITFITEDCLGSIWIGTRSSGMNRYDEATKKITHFENSNGFPDSTSWDAFTSRDGELWITTENGNLYRVDPFHKTIHSINTADEAWTFLEDKQGYLWVGTRGSGLFKFDQQLNLIHQFKHNPSDSSSLPDNIVGCLFQNQENTIWVRTDKGIRVLDEITQKFSLFPEKENLRVFNDSGASYIFRDKQGLIWFARWDGGGLIRYNPKDHSINHFYSSEGDSSSISSNNVGQVMEDRAGMIWAGSDNGLNRLDKKTGKFVRYLAGNGIWALYLYQDSKDNLWAGTDKGLYKYDKKGDRFLNFFDSQSEFNSLSVGGVTEDDAKNLWFFSESAIISLNLVTNQKFIYGAKYGIVPRSMATWKAAYKNGKGQIFIPHGIGFYTFSPEELAVKPDFKIIITDLLINSRPVLPGKGNVIQKPVEEISDLDLKYNQNNITFNFSAIDYRTPETIKYFTMLEGYDNIWREVKGDKISNYFNLSRGKYIYRVKAFNSDGTKAEKEIIIRINPPWWETWWAYSIYAVLFIGAVWIFIKWRTSALKKEKIVLEHKVAERTNELHNSLAELKTTQDQLIQSEKMASLGELTSGIAHEIKNPLNFIRNFSELNMELITEIEEEQIPNIDETNQAEINPIIETLKKNSEKINHHGKRIDEIVKGMLNHSRLGSITKEPVNINALCDESLKLAYHGFRAKEKTFNANFETRFDPDLPKIMAIPQDLGRVIINLINNAFYTVNEKNKRNQSESSVDTLQTESLYKPSVIVSTKKSGNKIFIIVSDNGMGIPSPVINKIFQPFFTTKPTGEGTGLGLSMSYDIISKSHGGELRAKSKEGLGTDFEIILPIS